MEILALQLDTVWHDKEANFAKVRQMLEAAAPQSGSLVCLSETFATGFTMEVGSVGETPDGPSTRFLEELAREFEIFLVAGVAMKGERAGRNAALAFSPQGQMLGRYDKIHPFSFGREAEFYEGGGGLVTFSWQGFTVAPTICYDLRFPELYRYLTLERGVELFLVIANWPSARVDHWKTLLKARAIENQVFVLGLNRCGSDPKLKYPGCSCLFTPLGENLYPEKSGEALLRATLDRQQLLDWRVRFPALADARIRPGFELRTGAARAD